jgi:hypothetical protein
MLLNMLTLNKSSDKISLAEGILAIGMSPASDFNIYFSGKKAYKVLWNSKNYFALFTRVCL